jgi:hypothetical protein
MEGAKDHCAKLPAGSHAPSPTALLQEAYTRAQSTEGRSTASVVVLQTSDTGASLNAANLGDGGFWILRSRGEGLHARLGIAARSRAQSHSFNCPFQLGGLRGVELNTPADADVYGDVALLPGDLVGDRRPTDRQRESESARERAQESARASERTSERTTERDSETEKLRWTERQRDRERETVCA